MQRDDITLAYLKKQVAWITQKIKEIEGGGVTGDVTWDSIQNKPEQFPPSAHRHNASEVSFEDGKTFQEKLDDGDLTGPQGPKGDKGDTGSQGLTGPQGPKGDSGANGKDAPIPIFYVDDEGYLCVDYQDDLVETGTVIDRVTEKALFME